MLVRLPWFIKKKSCCTATLWVPTVLILSYSDEWPLRRRILLAELRYVAFSNPFFFMCPLRIFHCFLCCPLALISPEVAFISNVLNRYFESHIPLAIANSFALRSMGYKFAIFLLDTISLQINHFISATLTWCTRGWSTTTSIVKKWSFRVFLLRLFTRLNLSVEVGDHKVRCPSTMEKNFLAEAIRNGTISWHALPFNFEVLLLQSLLFSSRSLSICQIGMLNSVMLENAVKFTHALVRRYPSVFVFSLFWIGRRLWSAAQTRVFSAGCPGCHCWCHTGASQGFCRSTIIIFVR